MELSFFGLRQLAMESVLDSLLATDFGLLLGCVAAYAGGVLATQRQRPGLSRSDALSLTASGMGLAPGVCGARLLKLAVYGGFGVFLAVPVILGVMSVNPYLLELIGYEFATQDVLVSLISMSGVGLVGGLMLATFVGPILEEVLFRGFVQPLAVQGLGPLAGVVLTSLLFGLIHGTAAFLPVFTLSLVLGILRQNSGHLLPAIVAHCLWNAGTMALSL